MCIFIYFGYTPPSKNWLCMKQNPLESEEVNVSVTSSASGRREFPTSIRPPQVPAFPREAAVLSPAWPRLGGLALERSRGPRWPARGSGTEMTELRITLSGRHCRGPGPGPLRPPGRPFPTWSVEPGAREPTLPLFSRIRHSSLWREGNRGTGGGEGCEWHQGKKPKGRRSAWPEGRAAAAPARFRPRLEKALGRVINRKEALKRSVLDQLTYVYGIKM